MSTATRERAKTEVRSRAGTPVWEIAHLFPPQGKWSEEAYLALDTNHLIEFKHGTLEFLAMPTPLHQAIVLYLVRLLDDFVRAEGLGRAFPAPLRTRTIAGVLRQPDVVFVGRGRIRDRHAPVPKADLVMEVVSPGARHRKRDVAEKRNEYADAGIGEYWIVDPQRGTITVLTLDRRQNKYRVHGEFRRGQTAGSALLPGFTVDVAACFREGEEGALA